MVEKIVVGRKYGTIFKTRHISTHHKIELTFSMLQNGTVEWHEWIKLVSCYYIIIIILVWLSYPFLYYFNIEYSFDNY